MSAVPVVLAGAGAAVAVLGVRSLLVPSEVPVPVGGTPTAAPAWVVRGCAYLGARTQRAGVSVPMPWLGAGAAASVLVVGLLVGAVMASLVAAVVAAAAVAATLHTVLTTLEKRYPRRVAEQLPGVAHHLADGLSAGLSFRQALDRAAADAPQPVRGELGIMSAELALGARSTQVLDALAARVPHPDVEMLTCAVLVHGQAGGNLARVLAELSERLDDRSRLARELRSATAQARMTAWLVGALPVAGAVVLEIAAPGTLRTTLGAGFGLLVSIVAAAMFAGGLVLIRRLGQVEP